MVPVSSGTIRDRFWVSFGEVSTSPGTDISHTLTSAPVTYKAHERTDKSAMVHLELAVNIKDVRQLENVCYWLTLMSPSQNIKTQDLPIEVKEFEVSDIPSTSWEDGMQIWLKNVSMNIESGLSDIAISKIEKMLIRTALERSNGKKNDAALILGWGRNTLSKKMKEHGI